MYRLIFTVVIMTLVASMPVQAKDEGALGIPLKPDPPIAVDGDLSEWGDVPGAIAFAQAEQVTWGAPAWEGPQDLSGTLHSAWRQESFFIAAEVTDDQLRQTQQGQAIWKGDHIEIYFDPNPEAGEGEAFDERLVHLALSPGNFQTTGDPLHDAGPEAFLYSPTGKSAAGVLVASVRTEKGWNLEAAIPWELLGQASPQPGFFFRLELAISDTDGEEARQESMMTSSSDSWGRRRNRLRLAALAGSDGRAPEAVHRIPFEQSLTLEPTSNTTIPFQAPEVPNGKDAYLLFQARLHTDKVAGHTPALRLALNGTDLGADRLFERPLKARSKGGRVFSLASNDRFTVYYAPDFTSPDLHPDYGLLDKVKTCLFQFRITDLLKAGENRLRLSHAAAETVTHPMHMADFSVLFRDPPPPPKPKAGPPSGALDRYRPLETLASPFEFKEVAPGKILITTPQGDFLVESRFSSPEPAWVSGGCAWFEHGRSVRREAGALIVEERFRNKGDAPLALMQRHEIAFKQPQARSWLAGLEQYGGSGRVSVPANATCYAATENQGIGLVALSDVLRVHVANYCNQGLLGMADNNLVIAPGAEYKATWAIVPTETPDYWRFINVVRQSLDVNFTIDGAFAFFRSDPNTAQWSDQQIQDFVSFKDARYLCASITYPRYQGHYSHGTAFQRVSHDNYRQGIARRRALCPEAQNLVYFHCFLDVTEDGAERYPEARTLQANGEQATYGKAHQRLFIPTLENSYGAEVAKNIDVILEDIKADGVYWDEHEYSRVGYHYGEPWDGVSGDIDAKSMQVSSLKSSVTLLSEAWRVALATRIQSRGPLIGNGAPYTRAMMDLHFPCFVETGSITNCTRAHLYSPIALGDHLTERSEEDAYATMLGALEYGCVYHWYNDLTVIPTHPHLTRYMYPITPLELHAGYILAEERILSKVSGLFGWGDQSEHEVHVFDESGREVEGFKAPYVEQSGVAWTELRIAEDWSAAIIRK